MVGMAVGMERSLVEFIASPGVGSLGEEHRVGAVGWASGGTGWVGIEPPDGE